MVRTIASIVLSFAFIFGLSSYEICYVQSTFSDFHSILETLHQKAEDKIATYEDGTAVRIYWENKKSKLHIWLPHTALQEVEYRLDETVGHLYSNDYQNALPQIKVLLCISENIPQSYSVNLGNIF